jgi:hypothetical protein
VRPGPGLLSSPAAVGHDDGVHLPDQLSCDRCARTGTAADVASGWSVSTPPRPTGSSGSFEGGPITMLCPDCARRLVRDLEARLDP